MYFNSVLHLKRTRYLFGNIKLAKKNFLNMYVYYLFSFKLYTFPSRLVD